MTTSDAARDLDVYEVAFLAGGVQRVVDTALVALVESRRYGCTPRENWRPSGRTGGIRSRRPCWTLSARADTHLSTRSAGASPGTSGSPASAVP
jgi:uncharacterized protein (TIGR04222 family)